MFSSVGAVRAQARTWIVSELYFPEDTSTGYFLTKIAEGLARQGPVSVICGQPSYTLRSATAPWRSVRNGVNVRRCWATRFEKDGICGRLLNMATGVVSMGLALAQGARRGDTIIAVTNPPTLPYAAAAVALLRKSKCVVLVHDVYPDALVVGGLIRHNGAIAWVLSAVSTLLYRHVAGVIVIGRDMLERVRGVAKESVPIAVIPHWADSEDIMPDAVAGDLWKLKTGLADKFVVALAGNIGRCHDIEIVTEAAERLADMPEIHFLIVGSGALVGDLRRRCETRGLQNVTVIGRRPRAELNGVLNAANVSLITLKPGMSGVSVPSRIYNLLAAGQAVIAAVDETSEPARVVREEEVGWVVRAGCASDLALAILAAHDDHDGLELKRVRARTAAVQKYNYEKILSMYWTAIHGPEGLFDRCEAAIVAAEVSAECRPGASVGEGV